MYDSDDNLVYSTIQSDTNNNHNDPNCITCHLNIRSLFQGSEKSYRIIDVGHDCKMIRNNDRTRHLLIRSPILNEPSCFVSSCHAHKPSDTLLGTLIIKIPLRELDAAVNKSSLEFFILAIFVTVVLMSILIYFTRKRIKDPLTNLLNVSTAVAKGDRSLRLDLRPNQLDDMRMVSRHSTTCSTTCRKLRTNSKTGRNSLNTRFRKKRKSWGLPKQN